MKDGEFPRMPAKRANGTERALDILETLTRLNQPASRSQLVAETGMPRSTVYAQTDLLLQRHWLADTPQGLVLGPQAAFSSNAYLHQQGYEQMARPILRELSATTGNLSEIDVVDDWEHVAVLTEGHLAEGYLRPVEGTRLPLMPTAAARILLADVPEEVLRRNIPDSGMFDAKGQNLSWERFLQETRAGQLQGYVTVDGWLGGLASTLACPIVAPNGIVLGSLCLVIQSGTAAPHLSHNLPLLMQAGQRLSALLRRISWPYAETCKQHLLDAPSA